jgi:hypothetical protein
MPWTILIEFKNFELICSKLSSLLLSQSRTSVSKCRRVYYSINDLVTVPSDVFANFSEGRRNAGHGAKITRRMTRVITDFSPRDKPVVRLIRKSGDQIPDFGEFNAEVDCLFTKQAPIGRHWPRRCTSMIATDTRVIMENDRRRTEGSM